AQNARPAPRVTTIRTSGRWIRDFTCVANTPTVARSRALSLLGRFSVSQAIPSETVSSTSAADGSDIAEPPFRRRLATIILGWRGRKPHSRPGGMMAESYGLLPTTV